MLWVAAKRLNAKTRNAVTNQLPSAAKKLSAQRLNHANKLILAVQNLSAQKQSAQKLVARRKLIALTLHANMQKALPLSNSVLYIIKQAVLHPWAACLFSNFSLEVLPHRLIMLGTLPIRG